MIKKGGLGKGLDALFEENQAQETKPVTVRISQIEPNKDQPRKEFDQDALDDLAESIRAYGLLQPLVVRPLEKGYQLVAGERRWRASRIAGLTEVPVIIRELTDAQTAEIAMVENLQREDLNPIEEAAGYKALMDDFGFTQDDVAAKVGRSRSAVANAVRLLGLPQSILELIKQGKISAGHGRALLAFKDPEEQQKAARVASFGANVREIERLAKRSEEKEPSAKPKKQELSSPYFKEVELSLQELLGRPVKVREKNGKGTLEIAFYNQDDLKNIALKFE
ncbi:MAG: ParB/RepB/Spo0J family partition protein [Clostridia bacterium]|nr:ParB/RepB/Spo0J family partition protein [Clostridia bacterium]